jgi:hypothetical protein
MSSRELSEWELYEEMEPFGERREDYRAASICHVIAVSQGAKNVELKDFLLQRPDEQSEGPTDLRGFAAALGAKVVKREPE